MEVKAKRNDEKKMKRQSVAAVAVVGAAAIVLIAGRALLSLLRRRSKGYPGIKICVNLTASEILNLADRIMAKSKQIYDSVAAVPPNKVCYSNVIVPLAELEAEQFHLVQSCVFPRMVSPSKDVREASIEAERRIDAHNLNCSMREDVYRVVKLFAARGEWLDPEARRYVNHLVKDFERRGLNATSSRRTEIEWLKARIKELCNTFVCNLSEENCYLLFKDSDLVGMPSDFLESLDKTEDGMLKVNIKPIHTYPILKHCKVGATRKVVASAKGQRCLEENTLILEELINLRYKMARLLGYSNYAEYALETQMARTPFKVMEFLEDESRIMSESAVKELQRLKDLKRQEEGESPFGMEDLQYYMHQAEEREFGINYKELRHYFPVESVTQWLLRTYQDLLGLKFDRVQGAEVWHPDVCLYSVLDSVSNESLGYFYIDLYLRDGKYGHTCVFPLQDGCLLRNGTRQLPVAAIIANFSKSEQDNPSFLRFSEVVTYFHEFGHVDIYRPIPDEICIALKRKQKAFYGLKTKEKILMCLFDQIIHTSDKVDTKALFEDLYPKVMVGIPLLDRTSLATSFLHLVTGNEATCYRYIWSEVFAADMFVSKFEGDILNSSLGMQYRNKVLAPGATKDAFAILHDFLGREPSKEAFMRRSTS
ncbi:probable thimet oligopeptidase isoform X2 [Cryptomeria japonica]|uniref:probable thimet oligopeptidase isoform X2 n=1 Tax=Cryptomeria japonica TaxID=3369 RepID=UPI0027DA2178|nr:probable thimet oligopeptidase isoform X2 [Cryptomeria japonica]